MLYLFQIPHPMSEIPSNNNISIRHLTLKDIPAFSHLRHSIEQEAAHLAVGDGERKIAWLHVLLRMIVNRKRMRIFVAVEDGKLIGFVTIIFAKFKKLRGNAYLTISVQSAHQGKGVGRLLMETGEKYAKEKNARRMELDVFAKNTRAISLYERLGYEKEGRRRNAVTDSVGFDDVILMAKFLFLALVIL